MPSIGQLERKTQNRVRLLFCESLGYLDLGNWEERPDNRNIEPELLRDWLKQQGYGASLINKALYELENVSGDTSKSLYDRNHAVYDLLRYGVKVRPDAGENMVTVWLVDWKHPENNDFAIAEEVTVAAANEKARGKRPDVVIYVNGVALAVLELKRSVVSVAEGIRQNLDNQKKDFIQPFFSTIQFVMAGNDTEGLRYGSIETREKYYLAWKESHENPSPPPTRPPPPSGVLADSPLDLALSHLCNKSRFLELIHDFIVFDAGTKKLCRHNQYFGVRAAQPYVQKREGGIIWHTQGSGKSLVMVWLAKWIRENVTDPRVLIVTDRTELDEQIEKIFKGVNEDIYRTKSGANLIAQLNATKPWLLCSLIHKFGGKKGDDEEVTANEFIQQMKQALPPDFKAKGNLFVFVDECHRTQSGDLHEAMKEILPGAVFIGFTGTPLLKADKQKSIEIFGRYIHTYKFDEAVKDGVVLDLRYEAREVDQSITSQKKIDEWFELKTKGLTDLAKAQLKQRWGTMQKVLSSRSRLAMIVDDILMDFARRDRLVSGRGNAMLVSGTIYEACKFFELFDATDLHGHCAIVTSYVPSVMKIKGEESGEGQTEKLEQYAIYQKMLADWFNEAAEKAVNRVEEFEKAVKKKFIDEPGQMKLLIVVDKLLTGFDAPSATYLYIDKNMHDHGLFQAICRVNRLDGDDKEYGYIIDYKDLFKSLEGAVQDYTSGAFDAYDKEDVAGLLEDRLEKARERLEETSEAVRAICEPVEPPKDSKAYIRYFCARESGDALQLKDNEPNRLALYKHVAALVRAYANIAPEITDAGFTAEQAAAIKADVTHFEHVRSEVKLASGDYIDLKMYEPAMRHLIDTYIRAEESQQVSGFDDLSLIQLIVERGAKVLESLPADLRRNKEAAAETIENNVRKLIIDESPINPKYYEKMSQLLDELIKQRKADAIGYKEYLEKITEITRKSKNPAAGGAYPKTINSPGKQALYDNFGKNEKFVSYIHDAVRSFGQDEWRSNTFKIRKLRNAIQDAIRTYKLQGGELSPLLQEPGGAAANQQTNTEEALVDNILRLVKEQNEY